MGISECYATKYASCEKCGAIRTPQCDCISNQLVALKSLVREMEEMLKKAATIHQESYDFLNRSEVKELLKEGK